MKKFLTVASLALITVLLALTFAGCGGISKLQKAYEKEGYTCTVTKADDEEIKKMEETIKDLEGDAKKEAEDALKEMKKTEVLTVSKNNIPVAVVTSYSSADKIKSVLGETVYNSAESKGYIKGKLVFSPLADISGNAYNIFKDNA